MFLETVQSQTPNKECFDGGYPGGELFAAVVVGVLPTPPLEFPISAEQWFHAESLLQGEPVRDALQRCARETKS